MTESYCTSRCLIVWTQEVNGPYQGQTHKAILAVGWRGVHTCVCVYVCGWGWRWELLPPILLLVKSSHERPCQKLQCGLSRPGLRQCRLHDATAAVRHGRSQALLQLLLFRRQHKERPRTGADARGVEEEREKTEPSFVNSQGEDMKLQ